MQDVIIVGGGVGGLYLANRLDGLDVMVLERNRRITPRDSGIVSDHFMKFFKNKQLIKDKINHMELLSQNETVQIRTKKPFAYILKREKFTKHLRKMAAKNAELRYETVTGIEYSGDSMAVKTKNREYKCKIIVGADGCGSIVRRAAKIEGTKICMGIMVIADDLKEKNIRVFFNKHYSPDFFTWIIPKNGEYGVISSVRPKEYLDFFRRKQNLGEGRVFAHPIPIGFTRSFSKNTILLGDACGQVKPLTGGGIMFSLRAARHAEQAIKRAVKENKFDERQLKTYESMWKRDFGLEIKKQLLFRNVYRWLTNREIDSLFRDFKESLESLDNFDYDKFSSVWLRMPKIKLLKWLPKSKYLLQQ